MEYEFRWPKKDDNPFLVKAPDPTSPTWASLEWLASLSAHDYIFATAFKLAGDKIIKELSRGEDPQHADMFFMPIAFLYRHSLELKIKRNIRIGIGLELIEKNEKLTTALKEHNLHRLWNYMKIVIEGYWPDGKKEDINNAERIILEFHKLDKSGQEFRYPENLSGNSVLERFPKSVHLTHFQDVFEAIYNFLEGCEAGLDHAAEVRNEMLSNCEFC